MDDICVVLSVSQDYDIPDLGRKNGKENKNNQAADILTKPLITQPFQHCR
jgi:hypothetical protein